MQFRRAFPSRLAKPEIMDGYMVKLLAVVLTILIAVATTRVLVLRASKGGQNADDSPKSANTSRVVFASDAAKRTLCLASTLARANLEYELKFDPERHQNSSSDDDVFQKNQRRWMERQGLWNGLSSRERTLLEKPLGTWSTQEIADGQWRAEAISVLLWALKPNRTLPPFDKQTSDEDVMAALPVLKIP